MQSARVCFAARAIAGGCVALAFGCSEPRPAEPEGTPPEIPGGMPAASDGDCAQVGRVEQALSVVDRSLVGGPSEYRADSSLRPERALLARSQRLRRQRAWQIAERVLSPVALAAELPPTRGAQLPAFQTWHGADDVTRIFRRLYAELSEADRKGRARFRPEALAAAWRWNDDALVDFEAWTQQRRTEYVTGISDARAVHGLGGLTRVTYSPAASAHVLLSYPEVLACRAGAEASSRDAGAAEPTDPAREACASRPREPACVADAFPSGSAIVKASFRRASAQRPLDAYATSRDALGARLASAEPSWETSDGTASPGESEAYTLELPNGNVYWLTGLHVMTKELDDWYWLSLWWSPDPDTDFGIDRPSSIPTPFNHYKLCSVVDFSEGDADATGGFVGDERSLGDALAVTHEGLAGPTWCSNPYIETEPGAAATNCIGCHQHAGSGLSIPEIVGDEQARPAHGRVRVRDRIDSDYVFGLSTGEDLGAMFLETEQHFTP